MKLIINLLTLCFFTAQLSAQDLAIATVAQQYGSAFVNTYSANVASPAKSIARANLHEPVVAIKRANKVSAAYEGYAIVVATSALPLLSDDQLFRQFGNLTYDQNTDGTYSYLILTPFEKKKSVKRFLDRVIKGKTPAATIVRFKEGKRK